MNLIFNNYLKIFIIGCMTFYIPGQQFYEPQETFFRYGAMVLFGLCFFIPKRREINNLWLGLILIYACFNTVLFHFQPENRNTLLNLFLGSVVVKEVAERIDLDLRWLGNLLAVFCAVNVLWIALQIHNFDPIFSSVNSQNMPQVDIVGFMALKSNLGTLAAFSFPFIWFVSPISSLVCVPLLWYGKNSAAVATVIFSLLFILWHRNRKAFWVALAVSLGLGALYVFKVDMPSGEFEKRFPVWFAGIKIISASSPWFGAGLGGWAKTGFSTMQSNGEPQTWTWAHNEFIQLGFELGLIGLVLFYAYFKKLFRVIDFDDKGHLKAVSYLIPLVMISMIHFPFHLAKFAGLGCVMIGIIEAHLSEEDIT